MSDCAPDPKLVGTAVLFVNLPSLAYLMWCFHIHEIKTNRVMPFFDHIDPMDKYRHKTHDEVTAEIARQAQEADARRMASTTPQKPTFWSNVIDGDVCRFGQWSGVAILLECLLMNALVFGLLRVDYHYG